MSTDTHCPHCSKTKIVHYWRAEMRTLRWIDDYKCLDCGHRWMTEGQPTLGQPIQR